jgi:hypothetical protein
LICIEYIYFYDFDSLNVLFLMTVLVARQPNIEPSLQDQTSIALNLFNTILDAANTHAELNDSRAAIEQDISAQECWEARCRHHRNQQ